MLPCHAFQTYIFQAGKMHLAYPRCFVDHSSWTENLGKKMVISLETIERAPRQLSIPIPRSCTSGGIIASVFVNSNISPLQRTINSIIQIVCTRSLFHDRFFTVNRQWIKMLLIMVICHLQRGNLRSVNHTILQDQHMECRVPR